MEVEWSETALAEMADLDKGIGRRVRQSVERFAETGAGNVKRLQDVTPPEFRLGVGDYAYALTRTTTPCASFASATAEKLIANRQRAGAVQKPSRACAVPSTCLS